MPTFDVDREEINAFEFGETYLFKEYLDQNDLFQQLEDYYRPDKYRFKVPEENLPQVRQTLDNYFYDLNIIDDFQDYCVVQEKQVDSSDILRNTVTIQRQGKYEIFLMKDQLSTSQAIEKGASTIEKSDLKIEHIQWKIDGS